MFIFLTILYSFFILFLKQSALHWGAKHGNENVVKLIAGTYKGDVNLRTVSKRKDNNNLLELIFCTHKSTINFHSVYFFFIKMK